MLFLCIILMLRALAYWDCFVAGLCLGPEDTAGFFSLWGKRMLPLQPVLWLPFHGLPSLYQFSCRLKHAAVTVVLLLFWIPNDFPKIYNLGHKDREALFLGLELFMSEDQKWERALCLWWAWMRHELTVRTEVGPEPRDQAQHSLSIPPPRSNWI